MSSQRQIQFRHGGKVSKDVVIKLFEVCSITTDNVEKISCIQNALSDSYAEKSIADMNDIIDDDENDILINNEV